MTHIIKAYFIYINHFKNVLKSSHDMKESKSCVFTVNSDGYCYTRQPFYDQVVFHLNWGKFDINFVYYNATKDKRIMYTPDYNDTFLTSNISQGWQTSYMMVP